MRYQQNTKRAVYRHSGFVFFFCSMFLLNLLKREVPRQRKLRRIFYGRYSTSSDNIVVSSPVPDVQIPNDLLHQYLWKGLEKWHDNTAVECAETKRKLTYSEIYRKSRGLAGFIQKYGLGKGDAIAIVLPNVPEFFIVLMGAIQSGVIISTVNPIYTAEEIKRQLLSSRAKLVFTLSSIFPTIKEAVDGIPNVTLPIVTINHTQNELSHAGSISFNEVCSASYDFREPDMSQDDVVLLPYSSGTTGLPKGVQLTHRNLVANYAQSAVSEFKLNIDTTGADQDVVPIAIPMYHLYGLGVVAFSMFAQGVKFITLPKFNPQNFTNMLHEDKPTLLYIVPPIVLMLLHSPNVKLEQLTSIRTVVSAAAPLGAADINRFHDKTGGKINLLQVYGMTECAPLTHHQSFMLDKGIKIGGSGFILPNTLCKIVDVNDPDCKGLGPNVSGELLCKGPQVMKGYFNNDEANEQIFAGDGWLRTGDIAHYDDDGHFFITDRLKELIKVKGYQVAPAELEEVLRDHPDIEDAAVIGIPHPDSGEVPKAFIVPKNGSKLDAHEIQKYMAKKVVKYKQLVGGIDFLEAIPKNPSGKILRKNLK